MGIYTNTNSAFPSQVVSDAEKASWETELKLLKLSSTSGLTKAELEVIDI